MNPSLVHNEIIIGDFAHPSTACAAASESNEARSARHPVVLHRAADAFMGLLPGSIGGKRA